MGEKNRPTWDPDTTAPAIAARFTSMTMAKAHHGNPNGTAGTEAGSDEKGSHRRKQKSKQYTQTRRHKCKQIRDQRRYSACKYE